MRAKVEMFGGPMDGKVITMNLNYIVPQELYFPKFEQLSFKQVELHEPIRPKIHVYVMGEKGYYYEGLEE